MNLIITGYAEHGKDTVCELLASKYNYKFISSSLIVTEEVIFPKLAPIYGYETWEECFNDRRNHRKEWFGLICQYNESDKARLGKLIFDKNDIYCGLRNREEFEVMQEQGIVDLTIWVDASQRKPIEPSTSITMTIADADYVLDNNGALENLPLEVDKLQAYIQKHFKQLYHELDLECLSTGILIY